MAAIATERSFLLTTVGKKYLMGLTGLVWSGFVMGHMAGNLLLFVSADAYNKYGHALTSGAFIYFVEAVLILCLVTHVGCALSLTRENRKARGPRGYALTPNRDKGVTLGSKTMAIQGSLILVFIILHLITFKYGKFYQTTVDGVQMRDLHALVLETFAQPGYVAWYCVAMVFLFFHLSHGVGSMFQSLGLKNDRNEPLIKKVSWVYGAVVAAGFFAQPVYCFLWGK